MGKRAPIDVRFARGYTVAADGCWLWHQGLAQRGGYGVFGVTPGNMALAHRWSYQQHRGAIPKGYCVRQLCGVRRCVNPAHLIATARGRGLIDARYPRNDERARAGRMLAWLAERFPPWLGALGALQARLGDYGTRRNHGWEPRDFNRGVLSQK